VVRRGENDCRQCFLSRPVTGMAQGRLTLCDDGMFMSMWPGGTGCLHGERDVDFTFDSDASDTTVVVQ
jgi:hypothetical protein